MSEWQPIETAPKDGTKILLYEKADIFDTKTDNFLDVDYIFTGGFNGGVWECWEYEAFSHQPTHWMPLPKPPL